MQESIERYAATLSTDGPAALEELRCYVEWRGRRAAAFNPDRDDDVEIRSYLLHLKIGGASRADLQRTVEALRRYYSWCVSEGVLPDSPFERFDFDRPLLDREQVRRRREQFEGDAAQREIARLRALNEIANQLNRTADVETLLDGVVETLARVMHLQTAWSFLSTESPGPAGTSVPPFTLGGCCGLPPGLERQERQYLQTPPGCLCQRLLQEGKLRRAVNVVECSRLYDAVQDNADTAGLLFHATVPLISGSRTLGLITVATEKWEFLTAADLQLLSAVGSQVGTALDRARLYDQAESQRIRLDRELETARSVQRSLLPRSMPQIDGFTISAEWRSARQVAGDFYDVFPLPEGRWGIVVADVSGKGAPAALYMAMVRSMIRAEAGRHPGPARGLIVVNERLLAEASSQMYVTLFHGVLDPAERSLCYTLAGHEPPFVRRADGRMDRLAAGGPILGILEGIDLPETTMQFEPGDTLVAYTDGVTDSLNPAAEDYSTDRLKQAIYKGGGGTGCEMIPHLLRDLADFTDKTPQPDDITLLVLACG